MTYPALVEWLSDLTYVEVVLTLVLVCGLLDLFVDWKSARPHKRHSLKTQLADEGIALAERFGGPSDLKLRNAVDWATARAQDHGLKMSRNEAAKIIEIRLPPKEKARQPKS